MAFIRVKTRAGRRYAYLVESSREEGAPRQRVIAYLGPVEEVAPERVPSRHRRAPAVVRWLRENRHEAQAAREARLDAWRRRLFAEALLEDRRRVLATARRAARELGPWELLSGVLAPLQREVGEAWHSGEATMAQEHGVTRAMRQVVDDLRASTRAASPPAARRARVLLANPLGEEHWLALEVLEWRLAAAGHATFVSAGGTATEALVRRAREVDADLVLLSATVPGSVPPAVEAARALRDASRRVLVGMGGQAWTPDVPTPRLGSRVRVVRSEAGQALDALVRDALARRGPSASRRVGAPGTRSAPAP